MQLPSSITRNSWGYFLRQYVAFAGRKTHGLRCSGLFRWYAAVTHFPPAYCSRCAWTGDPRAKLHRAYFAEHCRVLLQIYRHHSVVCCCLYLKHGLHPTCTHYVRSSTDYAPITRAIGWTPYLVVYFCGKCILKLMKQTVSPPRLMQALQHFYDCTVE